ncbi:hypothetical protein [Ferrimonas sp. YFM]|uniref:hypothetical protein n=1 Tax=Ferrimonas sp. YFM TaxID=3028878 RepID=UPI0025722C99|nr:hypothetical protein [Ferrimonas sp. YFM]BDY05359.1 hypothetical protein F0521_24000 [Ferrimonas sp. YFM]
MTSKQFLTFHSIVYGFFALALLLIPLQLWPLYGLEIADGDALFLSQHNSIFLGGLAALTWLLRDLTQPDTLKRVLTGILITNLFGVAITLYASVLGVFSGFGWSDPAFFTLLAVMSLMQLQRLD